MGDYMFNFFRKKEVRNELSDELTVIRLPYKQNRETMQLWKEVFDGDTEQFIEYYYNNIANCNTIVAARKNKDIVGMLHLNGYQIHLGRAIVPSHYFVGLAVKDEYANDMLPEKMIREAFHILNELREPFAFANVTNSEVYENSGFVLAYNQKNAIFSFEKNNIIDVEVIEESAKEEEKDYSNVYCKELVDLDAKNEDLKNLGKFAEGILAEKYTTFACREYEYYLPIIKQFRAENGQMILICEHQFIIGCFMYSEYDMIEIVDAIWQPKDADKCINAIKEYFEGRNKVIKFAASDCVKSEYLIKEIEKPSIMMRIINLEMFVRYIKAPKDITMILKIKDEFIAENNGTFKFSISTAEGESYIEKSDEGPEAEFTMAELTEIFFCGRIPKELDDCLKEKIELMSKFDKVYINEYV